MALILLTSKRFGTIWTRTYPTPSWSAKADHPRVFVFLVAIKVLKTTEKRGWSAGACPWAGLQPDPEADHDEG